MCELWDVSVFCKQAGDVGDTDFRGAVDVEGDNRFGSEECLREDSWEAFPVAGMHHNIHGMNVIRDLFRGYESGEAEVAGESKFVDALLVMFAEDTVADKQEAGMGDGVGNGRCGFDQVVVSFEVKESGDFSEDDVVGFKSELPTHLCWRLLGIEEAVDVHAAVDGGILLGRADAGGEVLGGHGIADRDETLAPASCEAFGESVGVPCEGILTVVESSAMNGVNGGDFELMRGEPSEDTGF